MIITALMGGLGNQMFQYAVARRLAHHHNTEVKMDLSWFTHQSDSARQYELDRFHIAQRVIKDSERAIFSKQATTKVDKLFYALQSKFRKPRPYNWVVEWNSAFDQKILALPDNVALMGYWQSYRYFNDIRALLIDEFNLIEPFSTQDLAVTDIIKSVSSVAIHIRRNDYVTNQRARFFHGCCSAAYYRRAIEYISRRIKKPHFFVFSDDMEWAVDNINTNHDITFVDHNTPKYGWRDLALMRCCKHNIIANSSFSWWAAWLNAYSEKIVVGPQKYYANKAQNKRTKDLFPPDWVRL